MQVLLGFSELAVMAGAGWVMYTGVATVERRIATWLLADARARDARGTSRVPRPPLGTVASPLAPPAAYRAMAVATDSRGHGGMAAR